MRLALSPKLLGGLSKISTLVTRQSLSGAYSMHRGSRNINSAIYASILVFLRPGKW